MSNPECGRKTGYPTRKTGYPTREAGWAAMLRLADRTGAAVWRLNVYRCGRCRLWHVGHLPTSKQKRGKGR